MTGEGFFQRRQAAAVLKHGVIRRYAPVFTTMTGSTSVDHRVVYLDGYAGRGGYDDGSPGSPLLAIESAREVARWDRDVECIFIEADQANYTELQRRLRDAAPSELRWHVRLGDVTNHLDETLRLAQNTPLLAFLDPYGSALGYDALVDKLLCRPTRAPTEVLLNLNIQVVQRWGGLLASRRLNAGQTEILNRLDRFFGGDWWRNVFLSTRADDSPGSAARAAVAVVDEFRSRVHAR
ncbi:three-Cys-motif partner protein TcmP, partial [Candidatus Protofrankia datiscae]